METNVAMVSNAKVLCWTYGPYCMFTTRFYHSTRSRSAVLSDILFFLEKKSRYSNFLCSMSCMIDSPSPVDFYWPYPKSTIVAADWSSQWSCTHSTFWTWIAWNVMNIHKPMLLYCILKVNCCVSSVDLLKARYSIIQFLFATRFYHSTRSRSAVLFDLLYFWTNIQLFNFEM